MPLKYEFNEFHDLQYFNIPDVDSSFINIQNDVLEITTYIYFQRLYGFLWFTKY